MATVASSVMYSNADATDIVAKTLYYEARGEGEVGIRAVASVLQNRASKRYGKTSISLCAAEARRRLQFSCWNGKKTLPSGKGEAWTLCLRIANEMASGKFKSTHTHTHYYAYKQVNPSWAVGVQGMIIGNHKFLSV